MSDTNDFSGEYLKQLSNNGGLYISSSLTKNTKGYQWEIKCTGFDSEKIKSKIQEMDNFFSENYGGQ